MDQILEDAFKNPSTGLRSAYSLYKNLKPAHPSLTLAKVRNWLANQEIYQTMKPRSNTYQSFIPHQPLEQFQIDLIYMPASWHNKGYKYILSCVDVFSKKGAMIPLKDRDASTSAAAMRRVIEQLGVPKSIYSDQGSEFKNKDFQDLLDEHNIKIIFALDHAPFVEAFNKTIKNRLYKYMALHQTASWHKALSLIVDAYNQSPHTSTGIAPNSIEESNYTQALMNIMKRAKSKSYEPIAAGDTVRIPVINKVKKGYKQQWTYETHQVESTEGKGLYKVNGENYPRKELQLIDASKLSKRAQPSKSQTRKVAVEDKIGKAQNNRLLKEISSGAPTRAQVMKALDSTGIATRSGPRTRSSLGKR